MPRFYFNTQDGRAVADAEGVELPDMPAAQVEAVRLIGELLREHAEEFWISRTFAVTVTDADGVGQFVIMTAGIELPTLGHVASKTEG